MSSGLGFEENHRGFGMASGTFSAMFVFLLCVLCRGLTHWDSSTATKVVIDVAKPVHDFLHAVAKHYVLSKVHAR